MISTIPSTQSIVDDAEFITIGIEDFLARLEADRLLLFRQHLHATVRFISPLLVELALLDCVHLGDAVLLIHPPKDWPWRPMADFTPTILRRSQVIRGGPGRRNRQDVAKFRRVFAKPGVVIRDADHPCGRFAIRPCNDMLGFTANLRSGLLSAFGLSAALKLSEEIPETLMMALPGNSLGRVVDHPLFKDRDYTIKRVLLDPRDGLPVITFWAPLVPFELPISRTVSVHDGRSPGTGRYTS